MRKTLLFAGLAGLTLASCSQEEVLNVAGHPDNSISFRVRTSKATRAADITTNNLEAFKVFGLKGDIDKRDEDPSYTLTDYFGSAVEYSRTLDEERGGFIFKSETPHYYPADGSAITLMAYAPAELNNVTIDDKARIVVKDFEVKPNITEQQDIIFDGFTSAIYYGEEGQEPEDLYFFHALTKVFVSGARNSGDQRYKYKVAGVRFGNVGIKGNGLLDERNWASGSNMPDEPEWTITETGTLTHIFSTPIEIGEETTPIMSGDVTPMYQPVDGQQWGEGSFMMIPQQLTHHGTVDESSSVQNYPMEEGVAYIGLLLKITFEPSEGTSSVVYPFENGVNDITETVNGEKYAWAAFPIGSNWIGGSYVDYLVDFSKGAGFVAPGAEGLEEDPVFGEPLELEYKPILGNEVIFTESVRGWNIQDDEDMNFYNYEEVTVGHGYEGTIDSADENDPFGVRRK